MRLWHDLLAAPQGMARGGRVGETPPDAARSPGRGGPDRLGASVLGLGERCRPRGAKRAALTRQIREKRARSAMLW